MTKPPLEKSSRERKPFAARQPNLNVTGDSGRLPAGNLGVQGRNYVLVA